jgi:hypothetical protein
MLFLDEFNSEKLNKFWNQTSRSVNEKYSNNKTNKLNETMQKKNNYFKKIDNKVNNLYIKKFEK